MGSDYIRSLKAGLQVNSFDARFKEMEFKLASLYSQSTKVDFNELSANTSKISQELDELRNEYFEACPGPLSILNDRSDGLMLKLIQVVEHRNFQREMQQQETNNTPAQTATDELKAMGDVERQQFMDDLPKNHGVTSEYFNFALDLLGDDHSLEKVLTEAQSQQKDRETAWNDDDLMRNEPYVDF
ncbi:hypothetical protein GL272_22220 [Aeromonas veronii]|uniref:hypothetical protein n=1 Tax=Aeromonas veronii TaxID=654 RepID=UPI001C5B2CB6|nr:hypothetical protein [Aeromonas veronii]MBW3779590.1 hypothetical protein [Aeromonas veronii]